MIQWRYLLLPPLMLFAMASVAVIETYEFSSPELEERYRLLSAELRCPKCQNQNIADSNAPISQDLRKLLYQQLEEGASDQQILDHMVARYGEFVRYRPRFNSATAALWLAPIFLLLAGAGIAVISLRSRREGDNTAVDGLSNQDREQLDALLGQANQEQLRSSGLPQENTERDS